MNWKTMKIASCYNTVTVKDSASTPVADLWRILIRENRVLRVSKNLTRFSKFKRITHDGHTRATSGLIFLTRMQSLDFDEFYVIVTWGH